MNSGTRGKIEIAGWFNLLALGGLLVLPLFRVASADGVGGVIGVKRVDIDSGGSEDLQNLGASYPTVRISTVDSATTSCIDSGLNAVGDESATIGTSDQLNIIEGSSEEDLTFSLLRSALDASVDVEVDLGGLATTPGGVGGVIGCVYDGTGLNASIFLPDNNLVVLDPLLDAIQQNDTYWLGQTVSLVFVNSEDGRGYQVDVTTTANSIVIDTINF